MARQAIWQRESGTAREANGLTSSCSRLGVQLAAMRVIRCGWVKPGACQYGAASSDLGAMPAEVAALMYGISSSSSISGSSSIIGSSSGISGSGDGGSSGMVLPSRSDADSAGTRSVAGCSRSGGENTTPHRRKTCNFCDCHPRDSRRSQFT